MRQLFDARAQLCIAGFALFSANGVRLRSASVAIYDRLPDRIDADARYVVYSHGLIVEGDDETPVSPEFGRYRLSRPSGARSSTAGAST